jgi:3-phosphoshikimate 1-carboxyvinyltransferase
MLERLGVDITVDDAGVIGIRPPASLPGFEMTVPGDPSAAAVWAVIGTIHGDAEVTIRNVCLNPSRTGFLQVLGRMGAEIDVFRVREVTGETVADITVRSARLRGTDVMSAEIASLVDEVPVLAVAAAGAIGATRFHGVGELRHKEVDRLAAVVEQLGLLGAALEVHGDDLVVSGGAQLRGGEVSSIGDHRMAMSLAAAAMVSEGATTIDNAGAASVSYPQFFTELEKLAA